MLEVHIMEVYCTWGSYEKGSTGLSSSVTAWR